MSRWTQPEIDHLEKLAGDIPFGVLVRSMKCKATHEGWPSRTEKAIAQKLQKIGYCRSVRVGLWTTVRGAAGILGCHYYRIDQWLEDKQISDILEPHRSEGKRFISRQSWRRLAREMPEVFAGFDSDVLFMLLEDRDLVDSIVEHHPVRPATACRVRCIETGQTWPSRKATAKEFFVSRAVISRLIDNKRPVVLLGLSFETVRGAS